ncbi:RHS repeat-associated core domain-containing protein, partial [Pectobacterium parmentieri]
GLAQTLKVQDAVVQASARYDAAGRVVERGHTQYQYDDCGRLAIKRETRPGFRPKETHFDWDVQDRLVRVSLPDGARWRYRYDAFGRRINKVREGQVPSAQAVARVAYRWDGDQLIGQQQYRADGSAAREVQWVYEPGSFRPLAQVEVQGGGTQLHNIVTDQAGTARELCSEEGDVHWRGEQGLWGAHREERRPIPLRRYLGDAANEEVYCELRYQGQLYDAETGLYYNRHRYYDAESGQYLSPDPIGLLGGIRPQAYIHNPLTWIDPLGLAESTCEQPNQPETVDLASPKRRQHILDGDATGGGHRPGTGIPGKSEFPQGWSDDKIMHEISDIATDPSLEPTIGRGGRLVTNGTRDGIDIRVIQEKNGDIVSGFPTNVPRNPR